MFASPISFFHSSAGGSGAGAATAAQDKAVKSDAIRTLRMWRNLSGVAPGASRIRRVRSMHLMRILFASAHRRRERVGGDRAGEPGCPGAKRVVGEIEIDREALRRELAEIA